MINKIVRPFIKYIPENNKLERIWVLAKTDFIERYYGTRLGIIWALINPLFQLIVYYFAFTVVFKNNIENFVLYLFSGIIIWIFFAESTSKGMMLMSHKKYIIQNININKLDLFVAALLSNSMGFLFNLFMYFLFSLFFKVQYNLNALYAILIVLNISMLIYTIQLVLGVLFIYFRDINHFWDMFLLAFFWLCPIFYDKALIYERFPLALHLNPLAGMMVNFREVFLYGNPPDFMLLFYNLFVTIVLFVVSLIFFKKFSKKAAEIL